METEKLVKINLGSGRLKMDDYINIDCVQVIDGNGDKTVDLVLDIEREHLPYKDNSMEEILADNILEHVGNLLFVLNECHRVLRMEGIIKGVVPAAGSEYDFKDPTHKRHFIAKTFTYFTGSADWNKEKPSHPRYADYGFKPWHLISLHEEKGLIHFMMHPRKDF